MVAANLSGQGVLFARAAKYLYTSPPPFTPGQPLNGGGVGGRMLWSWTRPPQVVFAGWIPPGEVYQTPAQYAGLQLKARYPKILPVDAGPEPEGGGVFTVIEVVPPGGWLTDLLR
jgi:hypothetical protein